MTLRTTASASCRLRSTSLITSFDGPRNMTVTAVERELVTIT
jgi:hypothetical protein